MRDAFADARRSPSTRLGGPLEGVPSAGARRWALDRPAVDVVTGRRARPSSSTRGARSGPARIRPRVRASSSSRGSSAAACSTRAAARGSSPSLPRGSGSRRSSRSISTRSRSRSRRGQRASNGVEIDVRRADVLRDELAERTSSWPTSSSASSRRCSLAAAHRRRRHVGLPRRRSAARARLGSASIGSSSRAGRQTSSPSGTKLVPSMATFSVRFLGCKVSFADAQAVRERLLGDGHTEVRAG